VLQALSIMRQVASALQRAAEQGIIHRDIKPENILLSRKGEVKVTDFGLSRCFGEQETAKLTQTGMSMGTPLYMSPEQVQGREIDPRTDIYSFGVTCYHMMTGQPPFRGESAVEVAMLHLQSEAAPIKDVRPDLPTELCQVIHKMMAKDPAQRYQTSRELLKDIATVRETLGGSVQRTQGLSLSQSGFTAAAPASPPAAAPFSPAPPADAMPTWRLWLPGAVLLSLVLAAAVGAGLRVLRERPQAAATTSAAPSQRETAPVREAVKTPGPREAALLEVLDRPVASADKEGIRLRLDAAIQLGTMYIEERRLDDADRFFQSLQAKAPQRALKLFGVIGLAVVPAFRDQARESNDRFVKLVEKMKKPPDGRPLVGVGGEYLEYVLLHRAPIRRLVVDALRRNAANIAPEALPKSVAPLGKLPVTDATLADRFN
jgi:eukaryotic-like serine/threonine-protein kinase